MTRPTRKKVSTALIAGFAACKRGAVAAVTLYGSDALIVAGVASFAYGVSLVWVPGVWLTLGGFLMRAGYVAGRPVRIRGVNGRSGEAV